MSTGSLRGGAFLTRSRIRPRRRPLDLPSLTICPSDCSYLVQFGGWACSQRSAAWALVTVAAIGWLTSWAIEAVSCPMVATRFACASSVCTSR